MAYDTFEEFKEAFKTKCKGYIESADVTTATRKTAQRW